MEKFLKLYIVPPKNIFEEAPIISHDNISIGPNGVIVDGVSSISLVHCLSELSGDTILGRGASGSVKKVTHKKTGKQYALKVMHLEKSDEFLKKS